MKRGPLSPPDPESLGFDGRVSENAGPGFGVTSREGSSGSFVCCVEDFVERVLDELKVFVGWYKVSFQIRHYVQTHCVVGEGGV